MRIGRAARTDAICRLRELQLSRTKLFLFAFIVIVLDLYTKYLVTSKMNLGQIIELPVGFVQLNYIRNYGAAFGIMQNQHWFFMLAAALAIFLILYYFETIKAHGRLAFAVACLILGGAVGNLIDRIRYGYVVDFIDLKVWPIFNVADIALTAGMVLLFLMMLGVGIVNEEAAGPDGDKESERGEGAASETQSGAAEKSEGALTEAAGRGSVAEVKEASAALKASPVSPTDVSTEIE